MLIKHITYQFINYKCKFVLYFEYTTASLDGNFENHLATEQVGQKIHKHWLENLLAKHTP